MSTTNSLVSIPTVNRNQTFRSFLKLTSGLKSAENINFVTMKIVSDGCGILHDIYFPFFPP